MLFTTKENYTHPSYPAFRVRLATTFLFPSRVHELPIDRAIRLSVKKWEAILNHLKTTNTLISDGGSDTCALCMWSGGCLECPVMMYTDYHDCGHTPYIAYVRAKNVEDAIKAAEAEIRFLKKLPQGNFVYEETNTRETEHDPNLS